MTRAKKISRASFDFNESQGRGDIILKTMENEMMNGTNPDLYEDGEVNTRYEITITVRELGDWNEAN